MRKLRVILLTIGCVAALSLFTGTVSAQGGGGGGGGGGGRGNIDPAQARQNMLDRLKESLGVTDDGEWNVLSAAIGKVIDARTAVQAATPRPTRGGRGGAGGGGGGNGGGANAGGGNGGGRQRGGGGMFGTPSSEVTALQEAVDNKAPADEIKTKLAAVRAAQATADAALVSAQDSLKKLLTSRQEAVAVLAGLLK